MIKPGKLDKGNKIGLLAPASFITEEQLAKSVKNLEDFGFKAVYNETILSRAGYLAGNDAQRAEEVLRMFLDPEIRAIHCVRGGYGALRILPLIDYDLVARNPKPFIGYSDVTAILNAINQRSKVVCFHGPMGTSEFLPFTFNHFWNVLTNSEDEFVPLFAGSFSSETKDQAYNSYTIREGIAEGQLVGGNLSIIASLSGTPYEIDMTAKIVFIEEIGEEPYRIDRLITQLLLNGSLQKANGIALGVFKNCETIEKQNNTLSLREVLTERLHQLGIPVVYGFPFGHIPHNATIPIGVMARLDAGNQTLELLDRAVV